LKIDRLIAAKMFAGSIKTKKMINSQPVTARLRGIKSPVAAPISITPVR